MNSSNSILILACMSVSIAILFTVPTLVLTAHGQVMIRGNYSNAAAGLEINFPQGWRGLQLPSGTANFTVVEMALPANNTATVQNTNLIVLYIIPKSSSQDTVIPQTFKQPAGVQQGQNANCQQSTASQTTINSMSGTMITLQCSPSGQSIKMKAYYFQTNQNFISVSYMSTSDTDFNQHVGEFDSSVNTLTIANTVAAPTVPEFPLPVIGVIAAIVGVIAVLGRTGSFRN